MSNFILLVQQTFVYAVPLLIVALAGMFAERSGVINLALEGEMIFGAFIGAIVVSLMPEDFITAHQQLTFIIALLVAGTSAAIYSLLLSFSAINLKADQTISGTALNQLAPAIVCAAGLSLFNSEKISAPIALHYGINLSADGGELPLFLQFFDGMHISTPIVIALFILLSLWVYRTKTGMRMRACGEHPQAAASVGINVYKMRYLGTTISGFLAGLGGYAYIATAAAGTANNGVGGMGFLALAIMIFGNWNPIGIALGALLFGFLKCIGPLSSSIPFLKSIGMPIYFYNIIPYVVVLIVLAVSSKKSGVPKAEGIPYDKGMR